MGLTEASSLQPLIGREPVVLILGTLPSEVSLQAGEYYANPRNVFWRVMGELFAASWDLPYVERVARLTEHGIAVWDVLKSARRSGSTDSSIIRGTEVPNDFRSLLQTHSTIRHVCFNGGASSMFYKRLVLPRLNLPAPLTYRTLPSTSPANTPYTFDEKLGAWRIVGGLVRH